MAGFQSKILLRKGFHTLYENSEKWLFSHFGRIFELFFASVHRCESEKVSNDAEKSPLQNVLSQW